MCMKMLTKKSYVYEKKYIKRDKKSVIMNSD